jgi:hypothetical protein
MRVTERIRMMPICSLRARGDVDVHRHGRYIEDELFALGQEMMNSQEH